MTTIRWPGTVMDALTAIELTAGETGRVGDLHLDLVTALAVLDGDTLSTVTGLTDRLLRGLHPTPSAYGVARRRVAKRIQRIAQPTPKGTT